MMSGSVSQPALCVFCGSRAGRRHRFRKVAEALGGELARRGITLVYGGASVGLMGALADSVLAGGGQAVGVIPEFMAARELAHRRLDELLIVESMHARKQAMAVRADAFLAMPGGYGTLEEIFEALTWAQLGIHEKPCGFLNVGGYFDPVVSLLDTMLREGFLKPQNRAGAIIESDPRLMLARLGFKET